MPSPTLNFVPRQGQSASCELTTTKGYKILLEGLLEDVEPRATGSHHLMSNKALVHNLWAFAKFEKRRRKSRSDEKRKSFKKHADGHSKVALEIAGLLDCAVGARKEAWCSACFTRSSHRQLVVPAGTLAAYICESCGSPTLTCVASRCSHMATRGTGKVGIPRYCAEHRHDIPSFEHANEHIDSLREWKRLFKYEKSNLARAAKVGVAASVVLGVASGAAFIAAPAIGGAVGTLVGGYSGAAATSYGLALLGGGSLAAGGLGMVGGTAIISAVGASVGGALGMSIANAYLSDDKSFNIELVRGGEGVPVVFANGFLSEAGRDWGRWRTLIDAVYPTSPVYRIHWGAKELKHLQFLAGARGGAEAVAKFAAAQAKHAARNAGAKLGPLQGVFLGADLVKNPWHTAKNRADRTGVALAMILARTRSESYVLMGHSLGGRLMVRAAQALSSYAGAPSIQAIHLLGPAVAANENWNSLNSVVTGRVENFHSTKDPVLKVLYQVAQAGSAPAGLVGFLGALPKMRNIDVSKRVTSHSGYFEAATFTKTPVG